MTTTDQPVLTVDPGASPAQPTTRQSRIPLSRIVAVELRKSFDTRAGFWLLAGIGIAALVTTGAVLLFAPSDQLTYSTFTLAISVPISVILPIIAILSVTAEWSQRSGLTTFTLVPHRGRVVLAKAIGVLLVTAGATLLAFVVGAAGNLVASATGTEPVWDQSATAPGYFVLSNVLLLMVGFTLGVLIRSSAGAIVAYFVFTFVLPPILTLLALSKDWFRDLQPWVDPNFSQDALLDGGFTGEQWAQLAVTSAVWIVVPLAVGLVTLLRSEVK
jgi:ABC-2 type transport system permease protein